MTKFDIDREEAGRSGGTKGKARYLGDWTNLLVEAFPAASSSAAGASANDAYVLAGDASLGGPEGMCHFMVSTEGIQPGRFRVALKAGPPTNLCAELRGLPEGVSVLADEDSVNLRFDAGGSGRELAGVPLRVAKWPRCCRLEAVAIWMTDEWGNPVKLRVTRGTGQVHDPRHEYVLESNGATMLLGDSPPISAVPVRRCTRPVPLAGAEKREVEFRAIRFAADEDASESRLRVYYAVDGVAVTEQALPRADESKICGLIAEVVLELVNTNRVLRVVTAPRPDTIPNKLVSGQALGKLIATVETEDGEGFQGSSRALLESLTAECRLVLATTAGQRARQAFIEAGGSQAGMVKLYKDPIVEEAPTVMEAEANVNLDRVSAREKAGCAAYFMPGGNTVWLPGSYSVRICYTERRGTLSAALAASSAQVFSEALHFQVYQQQHKPMTHVRFAL